MTWLAVNVLKLEIRRNYMSKFDIVLWRVVYHQLSVWDRYHAISIYTLVTVYKTTQHHIPEDVWGSQNLTYFWFSSVPPHECKNLSQNDLWYIYWRVQFSELQFHHSVKVHWRFRETDCPHFQWPKKWGRCAFSEMYVNLYWTALCYSLEKRTHFGDIVWSRVLPDGVL